MEKQQVIDGELAKTDNYLKKSDKIRIVIQELEKIASQREEKQEEKNEER